MATQWKVSGTYFETCNCEAACPCVFGSPPSSGECSVVVAWHIDQGALDGTKLDGLNVAIAIHSPGHMLKTKWRAAVFLDDKAAPPQAAALGKIFSGQAGGHPANLAAMIGEVLGVKSVPIEYRAEGKRRSLRIGTVGEVEIEALAGPDGGEVTIGNHPLCIAPGFPAVVARSKNARFHDLGINLEVNGKNGFYSRFSYQSA
jgi:hypothetical protein